MSTRTRVSVFLAVVAAILVAACSNQSDSRWLAAGELLVPPESDVIDVVENTTGLSFESGP